MKQTSQELSLDDLFTTCSERLKNVFQHYLHQIPSLELKNAMEYSLFAGGKHLRPLIIYATGLIFNAPYENLDIPACSVELIHTYSLIHDDLPCMDDAALRRGKPTCHKMYGEGLAVLTGDALHTLAMQILANHPAVLKPERRIQMMKTLTQACGPFGMAAGQALDISFLNDEQISNELLVDIYRLKTGALFSACLELGRLASKDEDEKNRVALQQFGNCIGLAFQIQDDILDLEVSTEELGKEQGIDNKNNKMTYPKRNGLTAAKEKVDALYREGLNAINYMGHNAQLLRDIAKLMLERKK